MNLIQIELTNKCNLNCWFCFRQFMTRKEGFMSLDTFKKSLKLAQDLKVKEVWLHNWGEPLLHPKLIEYIKLASRDFLVGFATNGLLLTAFKLTKLSNTNLAYLDISFNIETKMDNSIHLTSMYKIANELGIDCCFRTVVNGREEYEYMKKILKTFKVRWQRAMLYTKTPRIKKCLAKERVCVIQWDGTIVPCCAVINKEIVYGQVGEKLNMEFNELENEYCKYCGEVSEPEEVRRKL